MNPAKDIIRVLLDADTWVLLSHEKPDGDTLGSCSALYQRGISLGKECFWIGPDRIPAVYNFLPGTGNYRVPEPGFIQDAKPGSAVVVLDTANKSRTVEGLSELPKEVSVLNIDHHGDNTMYGTLNWIDDNSSSVGEMVFELFETAHWEPVPEEAKSILAAIATDTGFFRFPCTSAKTLSTASRLVAFGADISDIYQKIHENRTINGLRLWGRGLERARTHHSGCLGLTWLEKKDFISTNADRDECENLVNSLLAISGVVMAVLLQEEDGFCRASIRTREPVDSRKFAELWGGGGHSRASGCKIHGTLEKALKEVEKKAGFLDEIGVSCS
ncbi:MAG TPA: bifunctional oligoribonuclease/PAP phosphatase NrnA [Synergistetes bacterium]|nr:bifunctional oligoribonuclease/PAP phosphatase NrnA [Synergistota bacterium]